MSVDIIPDFVKYQIEWLTSHKDLEFEPVIEDAIVKMLQDTGKSFIDEQHAEKSSERAAETARAMSRIDDTIADVAYILDTLMAYRNIVQTGNCNSCRMARPASCPYVPKPGQLVRYNCPFFKGLGQEVEGNK